MQVYLSEEQSNELKSYIFDITKESIEEAKKLAGLDRPFLNQKEMAEWIGISVNTLKKLESQGLPCSKVKGGIFYSKEEVNKWLLSHQK